MAEELLMVVDKNGKVEKFEVKGAEGTSCLKTSQPFEKLLGKVVKRDMKVEAMKAATVAEQVKVGK